MDHRGSERERRIHGEPAPTNAGPVPARSVARLARLQRTVGNQAVARTLERHFEMAGERHTLTLHPGPEGPQLVMASEPEDVRKKLARFERTIGRYIGRLRAPDLQQTAIAAASFLRELTALRQQIQTTVGTLAHFSLDRYKPAETEFALVGKRGRVELKHDVIDADLRAVDQAIADIDAIAGRLSRFARGRGIRGLDPVDIERWSHEQFLQSTVIPKQQEVANVIAPHIAAITAELPGSRVKFRGSLARGLKSFQKVDLEGGARRFDPRAFDADAFNQVSDQIWAKIQSWDPTVQNKIVLRDVVALANRVNAPQRHHLAAVLAIEGQIQQGLKRVEGYQQTGGTADFSFVLQPAATSATQIAAGNPYKKEMLQQAGLPAVEAGSRHQRRYGEFQGGPATF
ncbi:MAG TPA: hypothetical protein VGH56_12195, partial [Solirubrobacteraceae bacterium]